MSELAGAFNEYGDFVMPLDTRDNTNAPGEIEVVGDLDRDDQPIAVLRLCYRPDDPAEEVWIAGSGTLEVRTVEVRSSAILTRQQALALAEALSHLVRPVEPDPRS